MPALSRLSGIDFGRHKRRVIAIMAAPMLNRLGALFKGLCWRFIMQGCDYGNGRSAKALLFGQHDLAFQKTADYPEPRPSCVTNGRHLARIGQYWYWPPRVLRC